MKAKLLVARLIKLAIIITLVSIIYKMSSYMFPEFFRPYEVWVMKVFSSIGSGIYWLHEHSLEIFLVWAGRFSRDFKNNVRGYFGAIVLFSTFRLNLARSKALKQKGEIDVD